MATQRQATKPINLSDQSLNEDQIELLKLGLTFTSTPKLDLNTMGNDLLAFICKLHLIYHFNEVNENEINPDQSLLKPKSTCTSPFTKTKEFKEPT